MKPVSGGAAARAEAARAVHGVLVQGRTLDDSLAALSMEDPRERAQAQALAYGTVRWHCRHQVMLTRLLSRPLRRRDAIIASLLSVGLFQIQQGRDPDYASVSATVEAARLLGRPGLAGLVNGVLRRALRESEALTGAALADETGRYAHPAWLIALLREAWPSAFEEILAANQQPPPLWIRVNRTRISRADCRARLHEAGIETTATDAFADALRVLVPRPVQALPGFADGDWSVQDAAAQLAAPWLGVSPGMRVLDACAAPGGKTTHLLEIAGNDLDLTAIDSDAERLNRVAENLARLGLSARLLAADAGASESWWDGRAFDRILLDAPCSATGVIRRHPDIRFLRRPGDIAPLARKQRRLLEHLWGLLSPGGRLLYVTCSVLWAENEALVTGFLRATPDAAALALPRVTGLAGAQGTAHGLQLLPGRGDTDGFYYALIEKRSG